MIQIQTDLMRITRLIVAAVFVIWTPGGRSISAQSGGTELSPLPKDAFSIVLLSDTQNYLSNGKKANRNSTGVLTNPIFESQVQWVLDNQKKQRIVFVSHGGDVVDVNNRAQWTLGKKNLDRLHGKIPYGISVGNHDMKSNGNSSLYQEYFPASIFERFKWYGGTFRGASDSTSGNNANSFQLIRAGKTDLVLLHLECNAPDPVLAWADSVLVRYRDRIAIVVTHMFIGPEIQPTTNEEYYNNKKGVMTWHKCHGEKGNSAVLMWEKCFRKHANIRMILSGDQSRANAHYTPMTNDRRLTVHALLSDYSATAKNGGIRIYRFYPRKNKVEVVTWDTIEQERLLQTSAVKDGHQHNFDLDFDFNLKH